MKKFLLLITLLVTSSFFIGCSVSSTQPRTFGLNAQKNNASAAQTFGSKHKILVAYFSHSGNTRLIANQIHGLVGGDIFQIKTIKQYNIDFETTVDAAREEKKKNVRPQLTGKVQNMKDYDVVFLGYPNWCGTMPMALFTFLEQYDFKGKTIVPFCTHGTSGLGDSIDDLQRLAPQAEIQEPLSIYRQDVKTADKTVKTWLQKFGYSQ